MNTQDTNAFLHSVLESQNSLEEERLSLQEGLLTEEDVFKYVNRICVSLELEGYEVPESFELGQLLRAVEEEILAPGAELDEDSWGDVLAAQKKKSFLGRAVGAVKGAISRGVTSAQTKLRRYHNTKAADAADKAVDPETSPKEAEKAAAQHAKHYVKGQALNKKLNPKTHAALSKEKETEFGYKHGSKEDAADRLRHMKMSPVLNPLYKKAASAQAAIRSRWSQPDFPATQRDPAKVGSSSEPTKNLRGPAKK